MIRRIIYIVAVIVLGTFTFNSIGVTMNYIEHRQFKVYYSGQSREIAERLMNITDKSYPVFKDLFGADHDLGLEIFWADLQDWDKIPLCRHQGNYGMPHMAEGKHHTHLVILPAVNIDMPETLVGIIEPLLDMKELPENELRKLTQWLGITPGTTKEDVRKYLSSVDFYIDFLVEIVHPHEIMHDFCYEFGIPENYGRDGRKAWWVFEGFAPLTSSAPHFPTEPLPSGRCYGFSGNLVMNNGRAFTNCYIVGCIEREENSREMLVQYSMRTMHGFMELS